MYAHLTSGSVTHAQRFLIEHEEDTHDVVLPCNCNSSLCHGSLIGWSIPLPQGTSRADDGVSQERTQAKTSSGPGKKKNI